jgi:hypothetical protein
VAAAAPAGALAVDPDSLKAAASGLRKIQKNKALGIEEPNNSSDQSMAKPPVPEVSSEYGGMQESFNRIMDIHRTLSDSTRGEDADV